MDTKDKREIQRMLQSGRGTVTTGEVSSFKPLLGLHNCRRIEITAVVTVAAFPRCGSESRLV